MKIRALALGAAIGFVAAIAPSCGPAKCGPQNCAGCCTADDKCVAPPNNANAATCGAAGNACDECATGEVCNASFTCAPSTGNGGGAGNMGGGAGTTGGGAGTTGGGSGTGCDDGCRAPNGTCVRPAAQSPQSCGTANAACAPCATGYACDNGVCTPGPNADCINITLANFQFLARADEGFPYYGGLINPSITGSAPNSQTVIDFAQLAIGSNTTGARDFASDTQMQFVVFEDANLNTNGQARLYKATSGEFIIDADAGSVPVTRPLVGDFANVKFSEMDTSGNLIANGKCLFLAGYRVNVPKPDDAPMGWTCDPEQFDDGTCWCGCGVADQDCSTAEAAVCNAGWTCQASWRGDSECDCGCGIIDTDCNGDAGVAACRWCDACLADWPADAGTPTCALTVVPDNNAFCISDLVDAGTDAGTEVDAGDVDAGTDEDAGTEVDAGDVDAGTDEDAGTEIDAGTDEDAGTEVDAGTDEDAGEVDAGSP